MTKNATNNAADYIYPLKMNGLRGRMLRMPPPAGKKREILYVYGHHSSLERWWGLVQELNQYGERALCTHRVDLHPAGWSPVAVHTSVPCAHAHIHQHTR